MAVAWDVSTGYIDQILREEKADVYPPFREFYTSLLRAGISTAEYDSDLEFLRQRRREQQPGADIRTAFKSLLHDQNRTTETYLEAIEDGNWTEDELNSIEDKLLVERDIIGVALNAIKTKKDELTSGPRRVA